MFTRFYSIAERQQFVNRTELLAQLEAAALRLSVGQRPIHLALFGPRRLGKTIVLKELMLRLRQRSDMACVYVNVEPLASTPWAFATQYIGWCAYWLTAAADAWPEAYLNWPGLLRASMPASIHQLLLEVYAAFDSATALPTQWLTAAFNFPERASAVLGRPLLVILDEFQTLRNLSNQPDAGDALAIFRQALSGDRTGYVLAGSHVSAMRWIVQDNRSPLFGQFTQLALGPLPREDARALAKHLLPEADFGVWHRIAVLCGDQPYYIQCVCNRLSLWHAAGMPPDVATVEAAFYTDLALAQGSLHLHCQYLVDVSLERARYHAVLRGLLDALAAGGPQTISALRAAGFRTKSASNVRTYLLELNNHGLVERAEENGQHVYALTDPVLARWINIQRLGLASSESGAVAGPGAVAQLRERLMRVSAELAVAKEAEVRELLRSLQERRVPGEFLGAPEDVLVPTFDAVEAYLSPDGQVQIDALGRGRKSWAVEVRWQLGAASQADLAVFAGKEADVAIRRRWVISRGGFRPQAVEFAHAQGILLSGLQAYSRLRHWLERPT